MPRPIQFKKKHNPIGFGDAYDARSVEGYRNSMIDRAETRKFNRLVKQREDERQAKKPLHVTVWGRLRAS